MEKSITILNRHPVRKKGIGEGEEGDVNMNVSDAFDTEIVTAGEGGKTTATTRILNPKAFLWTMIHLFHLVLLFPVVATAPEQSAVNTALKRNIEVQEVQKTHTETLQTRKGIRGEHSKILLMIHRY